MQRAWTEVQGQRSECGCTSGHLEKASLAGMLAGDDEGRGGERAQEINMSDGAHRGQAEEGRGE